MPSERLQRQIDGLLDEAEAAVRALDWMTVRNRTAAVLAFDPENTDARTFLDAAERATAGAQESSPSQPTPLSGAPSAPPLPSSFAGGRYAVRSFLGEGGTKRVYLAHDTKLDRDVAFALIKTEGLDADGLLRVHREAQAMARLGDHPSIVMVHDIGDEGAQPYIVSQHMQGGAVEEALRAAADHRLPLDQALRIAVQICDALDHAHRQGIIHRDLKPGNVWLAADGTAKLGDFGLAITLDRSRLTMMGMMVGTVTYMPPEQALGRVPDARSDLYSLGAMLYEMVAGRPPFLGDDVVAVISQHINTSPVAPAWHNPDVPDVLDALILRLLEKDPEQRLSSAAEVRDALRSIDPTRQPGTVSSVGQAATPAAASPLYRRTFVGRETELRQLQAAFDSALSGQGALMMVVGEPGIGKTSVCEQLATYAALRGGRTLVGHCYEEGSLSLPYLPFVEAMRTYVLARDPDDLRQELGSGAAEVARIVSEIRDRVEIEPSAPTNPEEERYRLLQAVTAFLRNAAAVQPLVIVLEDLHDADRGTLDLLTHVARSLTGGRLLIIGTYRDVEVDRAHPLASALVELRRVAQFGRVLLRGLTADEVQRMLSAIASQDVPWGLAEAVHRQTEGNPLFVQEVTRYLAEEGLVTREGGRLRSTTEQLALAIPEGLRDVIGKRLSRLSAECNRLLAIAAVIGRDFALATLEAVAAVAEDDLIAALEEAVGVGVLEERSRAGVVHYRFAHAFFRQSLYEELIAPRRIRLHQQIARALETQHASRLAEHATELAEHFSYSSDAADLGKAVRYGELAAERASAVYAHSEAAELYRRALDVQEVLDPDDHAKRCDLLLAQFLPRYASGDVDGARPLVFEAARIAGASGDRPRLVAAAVASTEIMGILGVADDELRGLQRQGLDAVGEDDIASRVRLMGVIGRERFQDEAEEGRRMVTAAFEMARQQNDAATLLAAVQSLTFTLPLRPEFLDQRFDLAREMETLTAATGAVQMAFFAPLIRCVVALTRGDLDEARRQHEQHGDVAQRYHIGLDIRSHTSLTAELHRIAGEYSAAEEILSEQREAPQVNWNALLTIGSHGPIDVLLRAERGTLDDIAGELESALAALAGSRYGSTRAALEYALLRDDKRCQDAFGDLMVTRVNLIERDSQAGYVAAALSEACLFLEDVSRAALVYDVVQPFARHCLILRARTPVWFGPADRYLGGLAALMERWTDAEGHFRDALALTGRMPAPPMHAQTQYDYARMLLRRDAAGDRARALALLRDAGEAAQRMGMRALLERVLTLKLEAQGVSSTDVMTSISAVATAVQRDKTDLRPLAAADGSVTIMFSDIEGSTSMNERLGDQRWMELLRAHNALISEQITAHDGEVVKTIGDAFMVSFQQPLKALRCAIAIQRAFTEALTPAFGRPSPTSGEGSRDVGVGAGLAPPAPNDQASPPTSRLSPPIRVRIGIHTGTPVAEGGDYYGTDVTLAFRIADSAHGGEIVVSARVRELVEGATDVEFGEPRELELKGLSGKQKVYTVTAT